MLLILIDEQLTEIGLIELYFRQYNYFLFMFLLINIQGHICTLPFY